MGRASDVSIKEPITEKREDFEAGKAIPLKGVKVEWCYFAKPDDDVYKCEVILPEKLALSMAAVGFNVKKREDGTLFIDVKRKEHMGQPEIWGPDGETKVNPATIGNGTIMNLDCWAKYTTYKGLNLPLRLNKAQVVSLVEYVPENGEANKANTASGFAPVEEGTTTGDDVPF